MLTIAVIYEPTTRQISFPRNSDTYGGTTIDTDSVEMAVTGINMGDIETLSVRVDFAVLVEVEDNVVHRPFIPLAFDGQCWKAVIPRSILAAAAKTRKLPFQLVIRDGEKVINSRNTLTLDITRAINATSDVEDEYRPYLMYRGESWAWTEDFTYSEGAVVTYDGYIFVSKVNSNTGNVPNTVGDDPYWRINVKGGSALAIRYLGDGAATEFMVKHDLDTLSPIYVLQKGGEYVYTTVKVIDGDTLYMRFNTAPKENEIIATIMATRA